MEQEKIQELQISEQTLQNLLLQRQAFQLELNEIDSAIEETKDSDDEIYKISGQIMIKAEKTKILKDLEEKKKILDLRLKAIEKQEALLKQKIDSIRKEVEKTMGKKK